MLENEDLAQFIDWDALNEFRERGLNPEKPVSRGMAENPDVYFQHREASQPILFQQFPEIVQGYMDKLATVQVATITSLITMVQKMLRM